MFRYDQYCPLAHALEVLGDRWTLLIIRDLMKGIRHFNDLERGLAGISRGLLSKRLRQLQDAGVIEKRTIETGRQTTEYRLTEAGNALAGSVHQLWQWGMDWSFGEPTPDELNSQLLMWRLHKEVNADRLREGRVVVQFSFYGAERSSYWLVVTPDDVNLCLINPGYDVAILITADLAAFFKVWAGRTTYQEALAAGTIAVEGAPRHLRALATWFNWSAYVASA